MHKKTYICLMVVFTYLVSLNLNAQKQANIWYFGQGLGLDFNRDTTLALADSKMFSLSENASICDENGNLLFYTDGGVVWNSQHEVFKNGDSLKGHYAVLIVPKPESKSLFYIFTLGNDIEPVERLTVKDSTIFTKNSTKKNDRELGLTLDKVNLYFSLVDVKQNTVIEKNKMLYQGLALDITAVRHHNKKDFWLITRPVKSQGFHVFLIDKSGFQEEPIPSWTGKPAYTDYAINYLRKGILKNSVDGSKIASNLATPDGYEIEILDFDNNTGKISNPRILEVPYNLSEQRPWIHGFEFSTDAKQLYVSANNYQKHTFLYQFDLAKNHSEPQVLKFPLPYKSNHKSNILRNMQIASDKKIYISTALSPILVVINQPDKDLEFCNVEFKEDLFSKNTGMHLPQCTHLLCFDTSIQINKVFTKEILFEEGKATIQEQYFKELREILIFLQQNPHLKIEISGHTDDVGNSQDNQKLSELRAKAVADYFTKNNISEGCIKYQGFGDKKPVTSNTSKEGRAKNRRIEFLIKE